MTDQMMDTKQEEPWEEKVIIFSEPLEGIIKQYPTVGKKIRDLVMYLLRAQAEAAFQAGVEFGRYLYEESARLRGWQEGWDARGEKDVDQDAGA